PPIHCLVCCTVCQKIPSQLKKSADPVSTSCRHWFCRQCITYWHQSASSGDSTCPHCGKRSQTNGTVQSKTVLLSADGIMSENRILLVFFSTVNKGEFLYFITLTLFSYAFVS
uniref:RING-type domain-containing protein n=1 Tax=Sander lucioperca TaxID=283035 RepID=A0A8D0ACS7_SANLU